MTNYMKDRFWSRAKRLDTLEWAEGIVFYVDGAPNPSILMPDCFGFTHDVDDKTFCRALSYHDDNNKRIFDKDIVEFTNYNDKKRRYLIQYINEKEAFEAIPLIEGDEISNREYGFVNRTSDISWSDFIVMLQNCYGDFKNIEVIGNSIDNIELIPVNE